MRIVVIGAGIIGSTIAFYLARRRVDVVLLDAGEPGMGASGHSFAWINAFGKTPRYYNELNRRSLDTWDRFARLLGDDIGLRWGGQLQWVATDEDGQTLRSQVSRLQSWGYVSRILEPSELTKLEPGLRPGEVVAAAISDNDGHVLATLAAQRCARRVADMGGEVVSGATATGFRLAGGRVASIEMGSDSVSCDVVVLAAGVATTGLAAQVGVNVPQAESPGVVVKTDPRPPLLKSVAAIYAPLLPAARQRCMSGRVRTGSS